MTIEIESNLTKTGWTKEGFEKSILAVSTVGVIVL